MESLADSCGTKVTVQMATETGNNILIRLGM